jgi:hypothetical protein
MVQEMPASYGRINAAFPRGFSTVGVMTEKQQRWDGRTNFMRLSSLVRIFRRTLKLV